jgi:hypothetical protein
VQNTIYGGKAWPHFRAPLLQLEALWKGQARPFGCAYTCAIGDTVTQGGPAPQAIIILISFIYAGKPPRMVLMS